MTPTRLHLPAVLARGARLLGGEGRWALLLALQMAAYAAVFGAALVEKYRSFGVYAWDLGVYDQAFYTTVKFGRLFYTTVELPYTQYVTPPGTQFAVHFSPILFLFLPLYAAAPGPLTLLLLKTFLLALGAVPVFLLARRAFASPLVALGFSGGYLLLPALQGINWFDFQPHDFLATFFLFTLYFLEARRRWACLASLLLALGTIEVAPLWGIAIGLLGLYLDRRAVADQLRRRQLAPLLRSLPILILLGSLAWLALVVALQALLGWQGAFHPSQGRRFPALDPADLLHALTVDAESKALYLLLIFGPLAFLALLNPPRASLAAPWAAVAALSLWPPLHELSLQYPTFILAFVVHASIFGARRAAQLLPRWRGRWLAPLLAGTLLTSTYVGSPLGPLHLGSYGDAHPFGFPTPTDHHRDLEALLALIPPDAPVLTQNSLFAHVTNRLDAYVFPYSATFKSPAAFNETLDAYFARADYLLLDPPSEILSAVLALRRLETSRDWGLLAEATGALLFRRGYTGPPLLFKPLAQAFDYRGLYVQTGSIVDDPASASGRALHRLPFPTGDFWYGPGVFLPPGNYTVEFRLRSPAPLDALLDLAVVAWPLRFVVYSFGGSDAMGYIPTLGLAADDHVTLAGRTVNATDLRADGGYATLALGFTVTYPAAFEFVGIHPNPQGEIFLDTIRVVQRSP